MRSLTFLLAILLLLNLAACGGEEASPGGEGGDAAAGKMVFDVVAAPACATCHSMDPGVTLVGPSLATIGADAGSRVAGESAEEYLRKAIVEPGAHVAEGFGDLMPNTYGQLLSGEQLGDLIAYLLTLK